MRGFVYLGIGGKLIQHIPFCRILRARSPLSRMSVQCVPEQWRTMAKRIPLKYSISCLSDKQFRFFVEAHSGLHKKALLVALSLCFSALIDLCSKSCLSLSWAYYYGFCFTKMWHRSHNIESTDKQLLNSSLRFG